MECEMPIQGRIYKWRQGSTFKTEAQVAGEFLEHLREEMGGHLTPTAVYEAAMDEESPIHEEFEWDIQKAAQAHWRDRAGNMMRHLAVVRVQEQSADNGVPAFMSVTVTVGERGYVSAAQVYSSSDYKQQTIDQALKMLNGLKARFGMLEELGVVWKAIARAEKNRIKSKAA